MTETDPFIDDLPLQNRDFPEGTGHLGIWASNIQSTLKYTVSFKFFQYMVSIEDFAAGK